MAAKKLFISYAHKDEDLKEELEIHLSPLKRAGLIAPWQDRQIEAGAEWAEEIRASLEAAEIVLLLVTPRFLASKYCFDIEMQRAMERHEAGTARVIPVILKPSDWRDSPFAKLQALPKDGKPVVKWDDQDEAFLDVAQGLRRVVASLGGKKKEPEIASAAIEAVVETKVKRPRKTNNQRAVGAVFQQATWVERVKVTERLRGVIQSDCRVLALVGITGIGKTALIERIVAELDDGKTYRRLNLDTSEYSADFASGGAALLRELGEELTVEDQKDPGNLLDHLLERLRTQAFRVQIDSLEKVLQGNEEQCWTEFGDELWLAFFERLLTGGDCASQVIVTSQDLPGELRTVGSKVPGLWAQEDLLGLSDDEQLALFAKQGLSVETTAKHYLQRLGRMFEGHPLVLAVMAADMVATGGNVKKYWRQCGFDELEREKGAKPISRYGFEREVKARVRQSLGSLSPEGL
ncbi:MAG: TIR domain-containing protein, partial [Cyanobacteria bacterium P01_H01_bin.15]